MATLTINQKLAERLQEIARRENRPVEDIIESWVDRYAPTSAGPADNDIEVPPDITDEQQKAAYRAAIRQMRPKLYAKAREYWRKVGDTERLKLTDAELDQQFWLIDQDGVPRRKSEKDTVMLPPDPLELLIGVVEDAPPNLSVTVRDTMDQHYRNHHDNLDRLLS